MSAGGRRWPGLRRALRLPVRPADAREDVEEEFRFHLAGRIEDLMARGFTREQAEAEAKLRLGNVEQYRDEARRIDAGIIRSRQRTETLDALRRELRHAVRA